MNHCIIASSASQDLNNIADYYLSFNVEAGEKLFQYFNKKCKQLEQFPYMGRSYSHIRPLLRGFPLDGYIVFYRITDGIIEILRVINGRQDLAALFSDENP